MGKVRFEPRCYSGIGFTSDSASGWLLSNAKGEAGFGGEELKACAMEGGGGFGCLIDFLVPRYVHMGRGPDE